MSNTKTQVKSTYETLKSVDVKGFIEKKGAQSYISWASAWDLLKTHCPDAQRKVYEHDHTGLNYFTDGRTCYVKVGVIANGVEHIDYLPIMDFRNNAIAVDKVNMFDVNKTIQRSTAKAIAMHGIGLSLWTGEDLSIEVPKETEAKKLVTLEVGTENMERVLAYIANNSTKTLAQITKLLSQKYTLTAKAKKEISSYMKSINK
jgi:hypothetical protein